MQRDWTFIAVVAALTLVAVIRVASTHRVYSATVDEPIHLASGYEWFQGDFTLDMTHPPLARVLGALPLRLQGLPDPQPTGMVDRGNQLLYHGNRYVKNLARARMGNLVLLALAIVTVAAWAKHLFGREVAMVSTAIFTSIPLILGHAGLLTTDLSVAATIPLALFALDLFLDEPSWKRTLFLGVAIGLGVLSKFSFFVFFPPAALVVLVDARIRKRRRLPPHSMAVLAIAFLVGWAGYRFGVGRPADLVEKGAEIVEWAAPGPLKPLARVLAYTPVPAPAIPLGMAQVKLHEAGGHTAYLLGRESRHGWWYYFPVVFFYKSPLPWLILVAWGAVLLLRTRGLQVVLVPAAILLTAMTTSLNIGARHILPIIPPLAIVSGYAAVHIWRTSRDAFGRAALIGLLAWLFIGVGKEHPDALPWFNELAQPSPSWFAADSNIDWGQDVLRLARVVDELHIDHLHTAFMNSTRLGEHGIHATGLVPHQPVRGWVAVSENWLRFGEANGDYDWLRTYRPVHIVGKTIRLYHIP
ncbi:MAG TPA: glycosyltransferase family 39 protein [Thermoanaerobaculia bacterium]|nr:glycosyltransferase family 39 protein [Thermoanaerobaculia bacterium]